MTKSVGVHEAKTHLSKLLLGVESGEEVTITRRGVAVARLVPAPNTDERVFGPDRGRFLFPDDWGPMDKEIEGGFETPPTFERQVYEDSARR